MTDEGAVGEDVNVRLARLTDSERKCLYLVDRGLSSKEIARELDRKPNSVDTWLRSAVRKLGVRTRFQAAKLLVGADEAGQPGVDPAISKLRSQVSSIPDPAISADREASAGEGSGPGDLMPGQPADPESRDSGQGKSWLEPSHPLARFFGSDNRLPLGQRILLITAIAIAISIAFTLVMSSFLSLSRLLESA
jgi:DNA-binding CsgD family transcriptional regulator